MVDNRPSAGMHPWICYGMGVHDKTGREVVDDYASPVACGFHIRFSRACAGSRKRVHHELVRSDSPGLARSFPGGRHHRRLSGGGRAWAQRGRLAIDNVMAVRRAGLPGRINLNRDRETDGWGPGSWYSRFHIAV